MTSLHPEPSLSAWPSPLACDEVSRLASLALRRLSGTRRDQLRALLGEKADASLKPVLTWWGEDPSFSLRVLALAKSLDLAHPAPSTERLSEPDTVRLRALIWAVGLIDTFQADVPLEVRNYVWHTGLTTAVAAHRVGEIWFEGVDAVRAAVVGLVKPVGILILARELGTPYLRWLDCVTSQRQDLLQAEQASLGFDHRHLSRAICRELGWSVDPVSLRSTAHGLPEASDGEILEQAAWLLHESRSRQPGESRGARTDSDVAANNSAAPRVPPRTPEETDELRRQFLARWTQVADIFGVIEPAGLRPMHGHRKNGAGRHQPVGHAAASSTLAAKTELSRDTDPGLPMRVKLACGDWETDDRETADVSHHLPGTSSLAELFEAIGHSAANCRRRRRPLSLILARPDETRTIAWETTSTWDQVASRLSDLIGDVCGQQALGLRLAEGTVAIVLEECDRAEALRHARALHDFLRSQLYDAAPPRGPCLTCSLGVATLAMPPRNFVAEDLVNASRRCLNAAALGGGGLIKSIDLL